MPPQTICKYPDCIDSLGRHGARGYCSLHYKRWKAHDGDIDFPRKNYKFTQQQTNEIAQRFIDGENVKKLCEEFGVTRTSIHKISRKRGAGYRRNGRHVVRINQESFSIITPESAYWIGMLITDGCVSSNTINLTLAEKDKAHIDKFKKFLDSDHKIQTRLPQKRQSIVNGRPIKSGIAYCLAFMSKKIASDLEKYGVIPRKTGIAKVAELENNRDFWRGVIDGDGCVAVVKNRKIFKPRLALAGSEQLLNQFREYVHKFYPNCSATVSKFRKGNVYQVHLAEKSTVCLLKELYLNSSVSLDRKYKKAMEIIEHYQGHTG